jgi:GlcNAc-P-P-Und epimerase
MFDMVAIIGGSGFIGTRLGKKLVDDGLNFRIVDKAPSPAFPGKATLADVRNLSALSGAVGKCRVIVNLAAEHRDDVRPRNLYDEVNVEGARNVCQVAREKGIQHIVFTSTVAVYGFAPVGTDESGAINPFNDYGRTKAEAEKIYKAWQAEDPERRTLVIVRPTVVFGERNRGNVYNLLHQISSGRFVMVGDGRNRKSMAYVENVAAFLEYSLGFGPGVHVYNYIDKPDFDMNTLVSTVRKILGNGNGVGPRVPYSAGYAAGKMFDLAARVSGRTFPISTIRVKKFCTNTVFNTSVAETGFMPTVSLAEALARTIRHEFLENHGSAPLFYSE